MKTLINTNNDIRFGLYDEAVDHINYLDYRLETPMGRRIPNILKKMRCNQFHFTGIIGPDLLIGMAVVDLKFITNGFFYVYNQNSKQLMETQKVIPPNKNVFIAPHPENVNSCFNTKNFEIVFKNNTIQASGENMSVDAELKDIPTTPLRLCSRAGYTGWVYTQKTTPIGISGKIIIHNKEIRISSPEYMALTDWTIGYMRRHTFWNWAATACTLPDGRTFGLNLSCGVNETSFTENAFWVNGKMTKINLVDFSFDKNSPYKAWRIISNDKKVDLVFSPESHRGEKLNALVIKSKFTQLMGVFDGLVVTDEGETIELSKVSGWVEDHYAKW